MCSKKFVPRVEMGAKRSLVRAKSSCRIRQNSFDVYEKKEEKFSLQKNKLDLQIRNFTIFINVHFFLFLKLFVEVKRRKTKISQFNLRLFSRVHGQSFCLCQFGDIFRIEMADLIQA